jgi:hypothetical protein
MALLVLFMWEIIKVSEVHGYDVNLLTGLQVAISSFVSLAYRLKRSQVAFNLFAGVN